MHAPKIGRNEICPCGSGKKHKKCCGLKSETQNDYLILTKSDTIKSDWDTVRYVATYLKQQEVINDRVEEISAQLKVERTRILENAHDIPVEIGRQLEQHSVWLERKLGTELQKHSPLFWLLLDRSYPWQAWPEEERQILKIIRQHLTSLFVKHGNPDKRDVVVASDGKLRFDPDATEVVRFVSLRRLFSEIFNIPNNYRRMGRGGTIHLDDDGQFVTTLPSSTEECGKLYDKRRGEFSFGLGDRGLAVEARPCPGAFLPEFDDGPEWVIYYFDYNSWHESEMEFTIPGLDKEIESPEFVPMSLVIDDWIPYLTAFDARLSEATRFSLLELAKCYKALNRTIMTFASGYRYYNCFTRGLLVAEQSIFHERLRLQMEVFFPSDAAKRTSDFWEFLAYSPKRFATHDVFVYQSPACLFKYGGSVVLDLTQITSPLIQTVTSLQLSGEMGELKGAKFEEYAVGEFARAGFDLPIRPNSELKGLDTRGAYAEIDVCVAVGKLLFVIECKAWCVTRQYLAGDPVHIGQRWAEVQQWLRKSDERAQKIGARPVGKNYEIPAKLTHVIPVVCSSFPEYIWSADAWHYLTPAIPRTCTVPELVKFLREEASCGDLQRKPYAVPIGARI